MSKHRSMFILAFTATLLFALLAATLAWATHNKPAWLTEVMGAPDAPTYTIYYATTCPAGEPDCTPQELVPTADSDSDGFPDAVEEMSGYLEGSRSAFVTTFGMNEPLFDGAPDRPAYMSGGCWGSYNGHNIWMCADGTSADWVQAKATALHELFHGTQWAYTGSGPQPGWVIEGQAAFMEDQVFGDLDGNAGTFLFSKGEAYLSDPDRFAITSIGYEAAWFWKYFAEQFGTLPNPGQGMDAVKAFWDKSQAEGISGITAFNRALDDLSPGMTFEDVYQDFVIANYARKLSDPALPAKYRYSDEAESAPGPLRAVKLDADQAVGPTDQVGPLVSGVSPWGVRYYRISLSADVPIISVDVHQDTAHRLFYALLRIRGGSIIMEERFTGRHFARSFANDSYDQIVLVVAGLDQYANYRLGLNAQQPVLNIVDPLQARPALVTAGTPAIRDTFLVKAEVLNAMAEPVLGIDPTAFTVTVGGTAVPPEDVITSAYLQGQYWLLVRAPALPVGLYNLQVGWSSLSDQEVGAVNYAARATTENVLVIDRSGSMNDFNKITAAKNAGRLYIDSWPDGDNIGVVSFSSDATVDLSLVTLNNTSRTNARNAVNALTAGGGTSIGDGATAAMNDMVSNGEEANRWAIVLLSDGMETSPSSIADFMALYNARKDADPPLKVPQIHAVALGPDADRPALQKLARDTGGTFQYAAEPGTLRRPGAPDQIFSLDLAELYRVIAETVETQQQIFSEQVSFSQQNPTLEVPILVDAAAAEGVFTANWESLLTGGNPKLFDPDGMEITTGRLFDSTHVVWRVPVPKEGTWHMTFDCFATEFCADTYLVEAALKSPLGINLFISPAPEARLQGLPVNLVVSLADQLPVTGATVLAQITNPLGGTSNLILHDDGAHGDGAAEDGLYGARFHNTFQPGSYVVRVVATGTSNLGSAFVRRIVRAFDIAPGGDSDQDGLPDSWEEANGTDPNTPDSNQDPDLDGLPNSGEYQNGTDPFDPDTDDGGEGDGSEVLYQKDPLDPEDDGIGIPGDIYVEPGNGFNVITFPVVPGVVNWYLFATTNPDLPYQVVNSQVIPTGVYTDTNVTNGTTYWYRMIGFGPNGGWSAPTYPVPATPKADPLPPAGSVLINNGAERTSSVDVTLSIRARDDAPPHTPNNRVATLYEAALSASTAGLEMRVSNDPAFTAANWEPYAETKNWQLAGLDGPQIVYIQFRDDAGNESEFASDYINAGHFLFLPVIEQ